MVKSNKIRTRLDQFIYQGEALAREIESYKIQLRDSPTEAGIDILSWAAGELTEYLTEIPRVRRPTTKISKRILKSRQKNQIRSANELFQGKCNYARAQAGPTVIVNEEGCVVTTA